MWGTLHILITTFPTLEETEIILNSISSANTREHKEIEPKRKQTKLQHYSGLTELVGKFHKTMELIIEKERKKPQVKQTRKTKGYPNKDGPSFFYPPKNYRLTPISIPKDLELSEKQRKQLDREMSKGIVRFFLRLSNDAQKLEEKTKKNHRMDNKESQLMKQMTMETKTDSSSQSNPSASLAETIDSERMIVGHSCKPPSTKKRTSRSILQTFANIILHNVNGSGVFGGNVFNMQLNIKKIVSLNLQKMNCFKQPVPNKNQEMKIFHNTRVNQPQVPYTPELDQIKGKVVVSKQEKQPANDHNARNKDSTPITTQKQSPIPRMTSRISWTEQERKEERCEGRDLEDREINNDNEEILNKNGGQTARYLEQWETINMIDFSKNDLISN
ncbi:MAG: hypothetical protein EZS28_031890 [Streblomastix strix]|uniref:Uncharacterized protein n=1 Tax=Streblomastix strix TaxID=222440 RepID=A0A5J4UQK1_9EUKA|nr:MAG: hypothetical protein EZS28_031890 [Streblomastix strix]